MHESLKNMLLSTEVIWIYDEPNDCAIVQQTFKDGRTFYCAMVYIKGKWVCFDVQETDVHGAQFMYECLVAALKGCTSVD